MSVGSTKVGHGCDRTMDIGTSNCAGSLEGPPRPGPVQDRLSASPGPAVEGAGQGRPHVGRRPSCASHYPPPSVVRTHPPRRSGSGTNAGEPEGPLRIRRSTNASVRRIALGTTDPGNVGVCRLPSRWHWHLDEALANRGFGMYATGQWETVLGSATRLMPVADGNERGAATIAPSETAFTSK